MTVLIRFFHKNNWVPTILGLVTFVLVASYVIDLAENGQGNITDIWDAMWWVLVTITTVGYGDRYPVTLLGRGLSVFVMVCGIAIFGILIATLADLLIEEREEKMDKKLDEILARLDREDGA